MSATMRLVVLFLLALTLAESTAEAQRLRRYRQRGNGYYNSHTPADAEPALPYLDVEYDYDRALEMDARDRARIVLVSADERVPEKAVLDVFLHDLADSGKPQQHRIPVTFEEGVASFELDALQPERVYRLETVIYPPAPTDSEKQQGSEKQKKRKRNVQKAEKQSQLAVGQVPHHFYFATSSDNVIGQKRRKIVMSAFKYYNDFLFGRAGNMDCWAFCQHHSGQHTNGWNVTTHYGDSLPELAEEGPIFGDYVRIPNYHSLLLLAYDAATEQVWTIEGNYNGSIVVVQRPLNYAWWVSHIGEDHVREPEETDENDATALTVSYQPNRRNRTRNWRRR